MSEAGIDNSPQALAAKAFEMIEIMKIWGWSRNDALIIARGMVSGLKSIDDDQYEALHKGLRLKHGMPQ